MAQKKQTGPQTPTGTPSSKKSSVFTRATKDHPIYKTGYVIGKQTLGSSQPTHSKMNDPEHAEFIRQIEKEMESHRPETHGSPTAPEKEKYKDKVPAGKNTSTEEGSAKVLPIPPMSLDHSIYQAGCIVGVKHLGDYQPQSSKELEWMESDHDRLMIEKIQRKMEKKLLSIFSSNRFKTGQRSPTTKPRGNPDSGRLNKKK